MAYGFNDVKQSALGALIAVIFFFLLRAGEPIMIDPMKGLAVGLIWIFIVVMPFINKHKETKKHALMNIVVTLAVSTAMALTFDMVTWCQVKSFQFFGTAAWLGVLLGLPAASFFDKMNINNHYERWYYRRRR